MDSTHAELRTDKPTVQPRQAIVLIHGIGEQRPMDTLKAFAAWLLPEGGQHETELRYHSKPDLLSENFEVRRLKLRQVAGAVSGEAASSGPGSANTEGSRGNSASAIGNEGWPETDLFEFYWAHYMHGTRASHVLRWLWRLVTTAPRFRREAEWQWFFRPGCGRPVVAAFVGILAVLAGVAVCALLALAKLEAGWFFGAVGVTMFALYGALRPALSGVLRFVALDVVGDAARYLDNHPSNIACRTEILRAGVSLLRHLHEATDRFPDFADEGSRDSERGAAERAAAVRARCRYGRIVLVGHSLGSVIAYDIARHYWATVNGALPLSERTQDALRKLADEERRSRARCDAPAGSCESDAASQSEPTDSDFQRQQSQAWASLNEVRHDLRLESNAPLKRWIVSDLVTLGSPLAYARLLMARDADDFEEKRMRRELPTCPPEPSHLANPGQYFVRYSAESAAFSGHDPFILHHAALFAVTRWTNIHLYKDPVGFKLAPILGSGIRELFCHSAKPVGHPEGPGMLQAHTSYWSKDHVSSDWNRRVHRELQEVMTRRVHAKASDTVPRPGSLAT